ncbi:hypothetical protein [Collimonas silvisoli]|uniref:hypothetical protein n=1 Tax=Collimonas silvisoli TaxID=2825884 RepID=UPI001B8B2A8B|nr:hypothetical protein [Collimonas silvisoli]
MIDLEILRRACESPRDRLDRLKADVMEVDLAERLGQLAPATLFERAWADHVVAAKTELMSLPLRLVGEIHALHSVTNESKCNHAGTLDTPGTFETFETLGTFGMPVCKWWPSHRFQVFSAHLPHTD